MRALSGAHPADSGEILVDGEPTTIANPRDAKALNIETIYQTLALADNVDAPANLFLGPGADDPLGTLDDSAMEDATRKVMGRLNPNFKRFTTPVKSLSGGQRQAVAIARAVHFNARILIMDEPTAALGPAETGPGPRPHPPAEGEGIGIFLISHDIHDVFDLSDRISVMYHGRIVGTVDKGDVTPDDVLGDDHPRQEARGGHPEGAGRPALREPGAQSPVERRRERRVQLAVAACSSA